VKEGHDFRCQICGVRIDTPAGPRADAAHIRPLGQPHLGPDDASNVLCLCPNDRMDEPVPVTSVTDRFEADMVCDLLRTAGLECGSNPMTASDSAFAGVLAGRIMIFVHADLEAAREVLAGADSRLLTSPVRDAHVANDGRL
jgi:hypothetical protein